MAYNDNIQTKGKVSYNKNIILSVINLATKEIAGVSSLAANIGSGLKRLFNNNCYEGVKITNTNNKVNIDVYINVYYGYNVSEISYRVQENIKNSLSGMVDIVIDKINVHVLGVDFETKENN